MFPTVKPASFFKSGFSPPVFLFEVDSCFEDNFSSRRKGKGGNSCKDDIFSLFVFYRIRIASCIQQKLY